MCKRILSRLTKSAGVKQADPAVHAEVEFRIAQVDLAFASWADALCKAALGNVITQRLATLIIGQRLGGFLVLQIAL